MLIPNAAEIIADGYHWSCRLLGVPVLYRPLPRGQAEQVAYLAAHQSAAEWVRSRAAQCGTILSHLIELRKRLDDATAKQRADALLFILGLEKPDGWHGWSAWSDNWEAEDKLELSKRIEAARLDKWRYLRMSCEDCRKWWTESDGTYVVRDGKRILRPESEPAPCDGGVWCPKGHWSKPELKGITCRVTLLLNSYIAHSGNAYDEISGEMFRCVDRARKKRVERQMDWTRAV